MAAPAISSVTGMPAMGGVLGEARFRASVQVLAAAALAFFIPSLILAGVPQSEWPMHVLVAGLGAFMVLAAMLTPSPKSRVRVAKGLVVGLVIAGAGVVDRGYFNQMPVLFGMLVAALAVIQGLAPALACAAIGAVLIPTVMQASIVPNVTDIVYAGIYLFGSAVLPWTAVRVAERRGSAIQAELRTTTALRKEAVLVLARAAEAKDETSDDHVAHVGELSAELARAIGLPAEMAEALRHAASLHDVGKLHVPDGILLKPAPLSHAEWKVMRRHTIIGAEILGDSPGFALARTIARSHHENWDGSGYPDGLRAGEIPLAARVVRLVDVFDALRNERPHKPAWPVDRCLDELSKGAGHLFDPELTPVFVELLDRWHRSGELIAAPRPARAFVA